MSTTTSSLRMSTILPLTTLFGELGRRRVVGGLELAVVRGRPKIASKAVQQLVRGEFLGPDLVACAHVREPLSSGGFDPGTGPSGEAPVDAPPRPHDRNPSRGSGRFRRQNPGRYQRQESSIHSGRGRPVLGGVHLDGVLGRPEGGPRPGWRPAGRAPRGPSGPPPGPPRRPSPGVRPPGGAPASPPPRPPQEHLQDRVREHPGPHVAPLGHNPPHPGRERPLGAAASRAAPPRSPPRRSPRRPPPGVRIGAVTSAPSIVTLPVAGVELDVRGLRQRGHRRPVARGDPPLHRLPRHRPIHLP